MATQPTNLPVPSESYRDLKFNAGKIDEFVTSLQNEYEDRFGNKHYTIEGIRWVAQQAMAAFGYITLDSFEDGNTLTLPNQILRLEATGEYYRWDGSFPKVVPANSTPESTGGIGTGKWLSVGDASLRAALAATGGVDLVNGAAKQTDVDKLNKQNEAFAYIEDYANLVVGDDWTAAVQASFDTGKEVIGIKGKQYKVTSIINSKGQRISGEFIINTTRYSLGNVLASSETQVSYSEKLRICYVESAYDLSELLYIKSLGFNAINHYCYFDNNGATDSEGTVDKLLNNAYTAGLGVFLGTESAAATTDLTTFITNTTDHAAVLGYAVYDEPGARGISVADQESKITTMRSATSKSLIMVDQIPVGGGPFEQCYSTKYDIVLCNSYSLAQPGVTTDNAVEEDLIRMRLDYGGLMQMLNTTRVIPVVAAFSGANFGTVEQMQKAGDIFGQAGNGEFGAFVWDGVGDAGITARIRDTQGFRDLVKGLAAKTYVKPRVTEAYLFGGGRATGTHWSLNSLLQKAMPKDPNSSDGLSTRNAWPTRIITSTANSDHTTTQTGVKVSGIAFKGVSSAFATTIKYREGFSAWVQMIALNGGASINGAVLMGATEDGYFVEDVTYTAITSAAPFTFGMKSAIASSVKGKMSTIQFNFPASVTTIYRNLMRGLFVYADW
nr:MAG TPA: tailspike protein [Caudoviricetes sp.]